MRAATYAQTYLDPVSGQSSVAFVVSGAAGAAASGAGDSQQQQQQQQQRQQQDQCQQQDQEKDQQVQQVLEFHMIRVPRASVPVFNLDLARRIDSRALPGSVLWVSERTHLRQVADTAQACLVEDGYLCLEASGPGAVSAALRAVLALSSWSMGRLGAPLLVVPEMSTESHAWSTSSRYLSLHLLPCIPARGGTLGGGGESALELVVPQPPSYVPLPSPSPPPSPTNVPRLQHKASSREALNQRPVPSATSARPFEGSAVQTPQRRQDTGPEAAVSSSPQPPSPCSPSLASSLPAIASSPSSVESQESSVSTARVEPNPAPNTPLRRVVVSAESNTSQLAAKIEKELQGRGQCLLLAESDIDISMALKAVRQAQAAMEGRRGLGGQTVLLQVRSYPDMDDSPFFSQLPVFFAVALHLVRCSNEHVRQLAAVPADGASSSSSSSSSSSNSGGGSSGSIASTSCGGRGRSSSSIGGSGGGSSSSSRQEACVIDVSAHLRQDKSFVTGGGLGAGTWPDWRAAGDTMDPRRARVGRGTPRALAESAAAAAQQDALCAALATRAVQALRGQSGCAVLRAETRVAQAVAVRVVAAVADTLALQPRGPVAVALLEEQGEQARGRGGEALLLPVVTLRLYLQGVGEGLQQAQAAAAAGVPQRRPRLGRKATRTEPR